MLNWWYIQWPLGSDVLMNTYEVTAVQAIKLLRKKIHSRQEIQLSFSWLVTQLLEQFRTVSINWPNHSSAVSTGQLNLKDIMGGIYRHFIWRREWTVFDNNDPVVTSLTNMAFFVYQGLRIVVSVSKVKKQKVNLRIVVCRGKYWFVISNCTTIFSLTSSPNYYCCYLISL